MRLSAIDRLKGAFALGFRAFGINVRDRNLAFLQTSFGTMWTAEATFTLGLGVFAIRQGGASAVAGVGLLRLLPSALSTPLLAPLIDRVNRREVALTVIAIARAGLFLIAGTLVAAGAAPFWIYGIAVLATMAGQLYRPAHTALQITLCRTPTELSASGVVKNFSDTATAFVGPLIAATLLTNVSLSSVFLAAAAVTFVAAMTPWFISYEQLPGSDEPVEVAPVTNVLKGFRHIRANRDLSLLVGLKCVQSLVGGALAVFVFVIAIDLLPSMGEAGAGRLASISGLGALIAGFFAILLVGSRWISSWFGIGVALWGIPTIIIGIQPDVTVALIMMMVVGAGNALDDLGMWGALSRSVSYKMMGRINAGVWGLLTLATAIGMASAPVLIDLVGIEAALIITGVVPAIAVALAWTRLRQLDRKAVVHNEQIAALQTAPLLSAFPMPTIEFLANRMVEDEFKAAEVIFEQGAVGDLFYVIVEGEVEVVRDGRVVATLGPGQFFGEIALLRQVPRTTAIRAVTDVRTYALAAEDFVPAVSGYSTAAASADTAIDARLADLRSFNLSI